MYMSSLCDQYPPSYGGNKCGFSSSVLEALAPPARRRLRPVMVLGK